MMGFIMTSVYVYIMYFDHISHMQPNMGSFKIQRQCAVSTYESMEQKYNKFEDSQGYLETPVFLSPDASPLAGLELSLCCL